MTSTSERDEAPAPARMARVPGWVISLGCAVALAVLVFPEIFFGGGSFSAIPLDRVAGQPKAHTVTIVPNLDTRVPTSGLADLGARAWQFEPTTRYMANVLRHGENPEWNPYLASGELGPETLDGMQFSPLVLAVAAMGASSTAFTVALMALIILALYCMLQLFDRTLGMHRMAGVGAGVVFLLNGWATSTLTDVTCVPYLMFPIVLYAVAEFQRRVGPGRFLLAVAAYASLIASTFSPGQVLDVILITVVAVILDVWRRRESDRDIPKVRRVAHEVGLQAVVPAVALLVVGVVFIPALDAYRHAGPEVTRYSSQLLVTMSPSRWLLVPTYLTHNLQSIPVPNQYVTYLGFAPLILTLAALPRTHGRSRWLLGALIVVVVVALGQHLGLPGLKLIGDLPGLRVIVNAYWGSLAAAGVALAFGVAVDTAMDEGFNFGVVLALVAAAAIMMTIAAVGATGDGIHHQAVLAVLGTAALLETVLVLAWLDDRGLLGPLLVGALAVLVVAVELSAYANHTRSLRSDDEKPPAAFVQYLQDHLGNERMFNFGRTTLLGDWGAALSLREVGTLDIMQIPAYRQFYDRYLDGNGRFLAVDRSYGAVFTADPRALDLLSVRYLVVTDKDTVARQAMASRYPLAFHDEVADVSVFRNPDSLPRARLTPALAPGPVPINDAGQLELSPSVSYTTDPALVAAAAKAGIPTHSSDAIPASSSRITDDGSTRVTVAVDAPKSSVLVLADSYHSGWSATVEGRPAHLGVVDGVLRGVVVPAGHSEVVFRYHNTAYTVGWWVSGLAVLGLLCGCGVWAWRRRTPMERQSDAPAL